MNSFARTLLLRAAPVAGAALVLSFAGPAWAKLQVGMLECDTSIGIGEILVRKQKMSCTFTRTDGKTETYHGVVHQYGVEVGMVKEGRLAWAVFAASPISGAGVLAGKYAGVDASAAAGLGLGADVLVGGSGDALSLQPVAVEGESGISLSAGVEQIELTAN